MASPSSRPVRCSPPASASITTTVTASQATPIVDGCGLATTRNTEKSSTARCMRFNDEGPARPTALHAVRAPEPEHPRSCQITTTSMRDHPESASRDQSLPRNASRRDGCGEDDHASRNVPGERRGFEPQTAASQHGGSGSSAGSISRHTLLRSQSSVSCRLCAVGTRSWQSRI